MKAVSLGIQFALVSTVVLGPAAGQGRAQWHYYYFDQPQPLTVNTTEVAIFNGAERGMVSSASETLSKHGIAAGDVRPSVIAGMSMARVPASARNDAGIRTLIKSIADAQEVEFASPVFLDERGEPVIITRHLHVGFHKHVSPQDAETILANLNAGVVDQRDWSRMEGVYRVLCGHRDGFDVLELANTLARRPEVRFAEPDMVITGRTDLIPNDPRFSNCWGLHNTGQTGGTPDMDMDGPEAWDITEGDPDIVVVIMDDGIQQDHPDINQIPGADFTGNGTGGGPLNECDNHGTAIAGTVSAIINNSLGIVGIAPGAKVASAKWAVSNVPCDGSFIASLSWLVNALNWAQTAGAQVTSSSFNFWPPSSAVTLKYDTTRDAGLIHFAASGNDGIGTIGHPADLASVNAVGALNDHGNRWSLSQYGAGLGFSAPGDDIYSTDRTGSDGYLPGAYGWLGSGTSFASPYAAGVAALVLSVDPGSRPEGVEIVMQESCVDLGAVGYDTTFGWGFVNAHQALVKIVGTVRTCAVNKLVASDVEAGAQLGHAVSIDGEAALVGARGDSCLDDEPQCGSAYVYRWSPSAWSEESKLTASDAESEDLFGSSVAVAGDIAVVGAPSDDHAGGADAGSAYVYEWDGDAWGGEQKLTAPDAEANDQFGSSVAIEADVALVGAKNEGNTGGFDGSGAVYVFRDNGTSWAYEDTLVASGTVAGDQLGGSVSISGGVAVLGAGTADCGAGSDCGAAYVFRWNGSAFVEEQTLTASDAAAGDRFGSSVSIDGDLILVGAWLADYDLRLNCGAVYIYRWNGVSWAEEGKLVGRAAGDLLGYSVSAHNNLGLAAARSADCLDGNNCGAAYFVRQIEGDWVLDGKLTAPDAAAADAYGNGVALGGRAALIGARLHDPAGINDAGAAYAHAFPADCNENSIADTCDILGGTSDDLDGDGRPDECMCPGSSVPEPGRLALPGDPISQTIRYLSFRAGDAGASQAIRVTFADLPTAYNAWDGVAMWVAEPTAFCESAGKTKPPCPAAQPSDEFTAATLQCEPHFTDWSVVGYFHVYHEGIIPGGRYEIQAIDESCDISLEEDYSAPLELTTSRWGDLVNNCTTCPCGPPDGTVGIPTDVTAALDKFKNLVPPTIPCAAVTKVRADLDWETPNQRVDISDVTFSLDAFRGVQYPPEAFSDPPTEDPCPGP